MSYSVPDDEIRETGVRFTVAELGRMADDAMRGKTPPPMSYNESVLFMALYLQRASPQKLDNATIVPDNG